MTGAPCRDIENMLSRIRCPDDSSDDLCDADQEVLLEFNTILEEMNERNRRFGDHHYRDTLGDCFRIARHTGKLAETLGPDPETQDQAIESILDWIASRNLSPRVDTDYRSALRIFGDLMVDEDVHPDIYERFTEIKLSARSFDHNPTPMPGKVIMWDDVTTAADTKEQFNLRDPALITTHWAGGFRPMSEFWKLTYGQIDDQADRIIITVAQDSKTGTRDVVLYAGTPYLRRWIENHPWRDDPNKEFNEETPLWVATRGDHKHISYTAFKEVFYDAAERVGLEKPFNPGHHRASRASVLASGKFISQVQLEDFFGWVRGSKSAAHYIARFSSETHKLVGMQDGALALGEDDKEPIAPVTCPDCGRYTPRHRDCCIWCPAEIEADLHDPHPQFRDMIVLNEEESLLDLLADEEITTSDLRGVKKLEGVIRSRDNFFDRIDDYIAMAERMSTDQSTTAQRAD